jgi:hypothetical protein
MNITYPANSPETRRKTDWRDAGACHNEDSELFFPLGTGGQWAAQIEQAKAVCRRCPSVDACLTFALDEKIPSGIFGGLTEDERARLRRTAARNQQAAQNVADTADKARQPRRERTLQTIFEDNTVRLYDGHLAWVGGVKTGFKGRDYSGRQIAFIVDRGREPDGPVRTDCSVSECVLPAHLTDSSERDSCGTNSGYRKHIREQSEICGPCRKAHAVADALLRRTGTSKVAV